MLCAISGEAPEVPVVSRKSGNVFEKRLIKAYVEENGKDPVTGEELHEDDLVELKFSRIVRPRPPTLTSIPSLLSVFQNEWDALALETYTLRQQLAQTRQELSTALYQHDAAVRVLARLTKERDQARVALSKVRLNAGGVVNNGDPMNLDGDALPEALVAKVDSTQETLSKTRRKRAIPSDWVTPDTVESFKPIIVSQDSSFLGGRSVSIDGNGELALLGASDGIARVYSVSRNQIIQSLDASGGAITDTLWWGKRAVISTISGLIRIFEDGSELATFQVHAGKVAAMALHPCGEILASVGVDKSYVIYDLASLKPITKVFTDSELTTAAFHPDGQLFAAGTSDGQIKVFDIKSGSNAANFDSSGALQALCFSENGTWLAAVSQGQTSISIWDLRKGSVVKTLEIGSPVHGIRWDFTGQFLAVAGPTGITIQYYSKSTKEWSAAFQGAVPADAVEWGSKAQILLSLSAQGSITVLAAS